MFQTSLKLKRISVTNSVIRAIIIAVFMKFQMEALINEQQYSNQKEKAEA